MVSVFADREARRAKSVPGELRAAIEAYEQGPL